MRNKLIASLLVAVGVLALAGSALAGNDDGPAVSDPTPTPTPTEEPTQTPELEDEDEKGVDEEGDEGETEDEVDDEMDDEDGDESIDEDIDDGEGAPQPAAAIAEAFGVSVEEVMAYHEDGIGFGALFKLYALSDATGKSVDELIAESEDGWAFGKKFKALSDEEKEELASGPKNLGSIVSEKAKHGGGNGGD